ncbi:hypothetical protein F3Y22_tig00111493pilonHSYRG00180 [Hibiscus syriacus]|uniref:FBD domain-containing protein n=1 Tax=Hibiscus syriacus TaxID=106335 RepID=A0A6A2YKL1_HIBSY|nr:hypothetical protein F3Y22_tig00111493pilonHSYRG00180 [Hibiscus syriacus]
MEIVWVSFPGHDFTSINTIGVSPTKMNPSSSTVKRLLTPPHCLSNKRLDFISQAVSDHSTPCLCPSSSYTTSPRCRICSRTRPFLGSKTFNLDACFGLKHLKVSCLALEDLTLEKCFQLNRLDVSGARLKRLRVASCFDANCGESWVKINAPSLRSMVWEYNASTENNSLENLTSAHEASIGFFVVGDDISVPKLRSVSNLLSALSTLHSLTLETECVETVFNEHNVLRLAYLFKSSPTLHTLILKILNDYKIEIRKWNKDLWDMPTSEEKQFWESQAQALKSLLNHLSVVKIHGIRECENEVSVAKFLLKHGKALLEMTLFSGHCNYRDSLRRQKIKSQMMGFSRASSNAKIEFL